MNYELDNPTWQQCTDAANGNTAVAYIVHKTAKWGATPKAFLEACMDENCSGDRADVRQVRQAAHRALGDLGFDINADVLEPWDRATRRFL